MLQIVMKLCVRKAIYFFDFVQLVNSRDKKKWSCCKFAYCFKSAWMFDMSATKITSQNVELTIWGRSSWNDCWNWVLSKIPHTEWRTGRETEQRTNKQTDGQKNGPPTYVKLNTMKDSKSYKATVYLKVRYFLRSEKIAITTGNIITMTKYVLAL